MCSSGVALQPRAHLSWSVSNSHLCSHAEILWRWGRLYWEQEACSLRIWDNTSNSCQEHADGQRWSLRSETQVHRYISSECLQTIISVFILSLWLLLLQNDKKKIRTTPTTSDCKMSVWKRATEIDVPASFFQSL